MESGHFCPDCHQPCSCRDGEQAIEDCTHDCGPEVLDNPDTSEYEDDPDPD